MDHEVFICHASEDKGTANAVCATLEKDGIGCWIAPRDVPPAEDYGEAIVRGIAASSVVVFVYSAHTNDSPHIRRELERAVSVGIPILPFRIEKVPPSDSLQYYLSGVQWLDAFPPPLESHLSELTKAVRVWLGGNKQPPGNDGTRSVPSSVTSEPARQPGATPSNFVRRHAAWLIAAGVVLAGIVGLVIYNAASDSSTGSPKVSAPAVAAAAVPTPSIAGSQKTSWGYVLSGIVNPSDVASGKISVIVIAKDEATGKKYTSDPAGVGNDGQWTTQIGLPDTATNLRFLPGIVRHRETLGFTGPPSPQVVTKDPPFEATGPQYRP